MGFLRRSDPHVRCDAHLAELKSEWSKERDILLAWIENLQMQLGAAAIPHQPDTQGPVDERLALYVGEEEESLLDAHASGLISDEQLEESMSQLGTLTKIEFG